jgi:uncharacterized protein (UPF0335 family)
METETQSMTLEQIVEKIERMNKIQHVQILQIIKENNPSLTINETQKGTMINLSCVSNETVEELVKYIDYVQRQDQALNQVEMEKREIYDQFFIPNAQE